MEQPSSSSKVTVEYFDPHGVYQLLSPGLLPRLPLKNLHWESHAGPLRSISTLHIDLVPSIHDSPASSLPNSTSVTSPGLSRVRSPDSSVGDDGFQTQNLGQSASQRRDSRAKPIDIVKGRRHQIPGLRQTPYLKVYFLRCDDNDTYKAQARKEVREWIKEHTPPAQSTTKVSSQENHDAYEWLIVHVIVPNTAAATQPRTSGKSAEGSSGSGSQGTARWRGGGSSTILEKLRADFNGSSRSSPDRIVQIRIGINDVPYEMLPRVVPAIPGSYTETPHDNENAWIDLVTKLKYLILSSFDMRVSQYEEDIREKDAQRSLPGWNFCTFFVLKEGLARGFESVGLVEDALVGYDELAIGLDTIIREKTSGDSGAEHGASFLQYTEDLKDHFERAKRLAAGDAGTDSADDDESIDLQSSEKPANFERYEIPLDATRKRYRELILSNDVSVFDFRCYLFSRQLALLLRLANASSSQEELLAKLKEQRESSLQGVAARKPSIKPLEDTENLSMLGEVCRRAMTFVASISSIMREDLLASQRPKDKKTHETRVQISPEDEQIIENIVVSFSFAITQQILAQTSTKALPIPPSTLAPPSSKIGLDGQEPKAAIPEPKTMMHPARSTSLAIRPPGRDPSPGLFPADRRASLPETQGSSTFLKAGLEDLAAHRAELYMLSRSMLERIGGDREWSVGWEEVTSDQAQMQDIDLEEEFHTPQDGSENLPKTVILHGIDNKLLRTALDNREDFYRLWETLTDKALRHYTVANHFQSVQARMADLAVLKYHQADYAAAASYFYRMTPFYGEGGWSQIEVAMLKMYAKSLKELQRKEEYVRVVLKLLAKSAEVEREKLASKPAFKIGRTNSIKPEFIETESYVTELLELTKTLQHEYHVPLQNIFARVEVIGAPQYLPDNDGIFLELGLRYLLSEDIGIDKARVCLISASGEPTKEIWLESSESVLFRNGFVKVRVKTNKIIPGTYSISQIALHTSAITLHYATDNPGLSPVQSDAFFKSPKLLIYHRAEAFDVKLFTSRYLHLDRNRSLEFELSSGWNDVIHGELNIRPATAGLRLQTSEVSTINGSLDVSKNSEPGLVKFGKLPSNTVIKLRMPFSLEHEVQDISLKLEISYTTEKGTFFYATTESMSIMLPLGVNVQDIFKHNALFSRFTISSATESPLRLLSSSLENSDIFEAETGQEITKPIMVFPRQPAAMLYKITRTSNVSSHGASSKKALALVLHYICLEEEIDQAVTKSLIEVLKNTPLYLFARLVLPVVLRQLHANLSPYDLEKTAVLNEVSTSILSSVRWQDIFAGLGRLSDQEQDTAILLAEKLQRWQQDSPNISLLSESPDPDAVAQSRSIVIPVDIPSVTVVHTVDLKLAKNTTIVSNTAVAAVNQPIAATLHIKWTTAWNIDAILNPQQPSSGENSTPAQPESLDFAYEVHAHTDYWIIGGRRKGHFKVTNVGEQKAGIKHKAPIVLIPIREGYLPYPIVEIYHLPASKAVKNSRPGTAGTAATESEAKLVVTCETDYKNVGETVRVISDAQKTTVSLDASGPQGGAWLLESDRRSDGLVIG